MGDEAADGFFSIPPDTHGAAGPNHLMVTLNSHVRIQNKTGGTISTVSLNSFWSAVNGGTGAFDPKILYDPFNSRWIFTACDDSVSASSGILIGVSQSNDPTGAWNLYKKDVDATNAVWGDYPSIGFNKDWVVVQLNMFNVSNNFFNRGHVYVFDKADLYADGGGAFTLFSDASMFSAAPAITYDNSLATSFLIEEWSSGAGQLRLSTITGPVGSETLTTGVAFPTTSAWAFNPPGFADFAPQSGSTRKIQNNDARIQNLVYRNGSLWTTHTVFLPSGTPTRASVQWWQITTAGAVSQVARIDDAVTGKFYAFPSIAVNASNDVLIGYSRFSASQFASGNYSFRASSDPPNTLQSDAVLKAGEAKYDKDFGSGKNRWGDYSNTMVDPTNDIEFWTIQEYAAAPSGGLDRWGTWWGKVTPPNASFLSINDVAVTEGNSGTKMATFMVTLSPPSLQTVTVHYATADGTAKVSDGDFVATSGDLTFTPGVVTQPVNVIVNGDTKFEASETFFVNLSNPVNAGIADGQGQGTITNDDAMPSLSIGDAVVTEGNSGSVSAVFTVTLSSASGTSTTVSYATADGTATAASGDYMAKSGTLTIPAGSTTGTITVTVFGDTVTEPDETFFVDLSSPAGATISDSRGQGTIVNDDGRAALCRPITSLPYTITVQGSYCLIRNLSTPIATGAAITINADFVVLDLKGFKIGGGAAGPGTQTSGVYALNRKNITIKNGNIRGFLSAVLLEDDSGTFTVSQGHVIQNLRADENTHAGIHVQGRGTIIRGNQVVTTGGSTVFGVDADAYGIRTEGAEVRILNNDVTDTDPTGIGSGIAIAVEEATGSVVEKNRLANSVPNDSYGVKAVSGANVLVIGNRISGTAFGVFYESATGRYRDNLTTGVIAPYTGGTDAGNNQ